MENTIYKIINANVRKTFSDLDSTKKHIKDKKVKPNDKSNKIKIEKTVTITEISEVEVEIQKLTIQGANRFLKDLKNFAENRIF